jgi:hypothetical protein
MASEFTKPFSETCTECHSGVDPAIRIVDVVAGSWKGDGHFGQSLKNCPHAGTDEEVCNDHISRTSVCQCFARADENSTTDVGA